MDFFFNNLKKLLTFVFCLVFVISVTYTPQRYGELNTVPTAEAQWAVIDAANLAVNTAILGGTTLITTKELTLDNIGWVLSKVLIANLVASTVDWINSGFRGSPAFVQDLDRFLLNVADQVAGAYLEELGGPLSYLCSPFRLDIQVALALEYQQARERLPYQGCRLSEAFDNFEAFVEGDFLQGGWKDFIQITTEPERYTSYGAMQAARQALEEEIAAEQASEREVLNYGDGFLSFKTCTDVTGPQGNVYQDCQVVTPGKTIATRLSDSLGLSEDTLLSADEFNEIIGALISQLAVKALTGTAGLLGLSSNSVYADTGYSGSYTDSIRQEARDSQQGAISDAAGDITDTLQTQRDYQALANTYNQRAQAVRDNPAADSERRTGAQRVISETQTVIVRTARNITEIEQVLSRYNALETEYNSPNTTSSRKDQILDEQGSLVVQTIQAGYYSEADIAASERTWEITLNPPSDN